MNWELIKKMCPMAHQMFMNHKPYNCAFQTIEQLKVWEYELCRISGLVVEFFDQQGIYLGMGYMPVSIFYGTLEKDGFAKEYTQQHKRRYETEVELFEMAFRTLEHQLRKENK